MLKYTPLLIICFQMILVDNSFSDVITNKVVQKSITRAPASIVNTTKLWPKKNKRDQSVKLKVLFLSGSMKNRKLVTDYANIWSKYANIDFSFYHIANFRGVADITIDIITDEGSSSKGGSSAVGTDSIYSAKRKKASMKLFIDPKRNLFDLKRFVLHEFGHAIGLHHEHQHPQRTFEFNTDELYNRCDRLGYNREECRSFNLEVFNHTRYRLFPYDPTSIMHYSFEKEVFNFYEKEVLLNFSYLSLQDKLAIAQAYPGRITAAQIRVEHQEMMDYFERIEQVGICTVKEYHHENTWFTYEYSGLPSGLTPKKPNLTYSTKHDVLSVMNEDKLCHITQEEINAYQKQEELKTRNEYQQYLNNSHELCRILPPGTRSASPYIEQVTIHNVNKITGQKGRYAVKIKNLNAPLAAGDDFSQAWENLKSQAKCMRF